jgi:two-component system cell cycle sensor histidine kinase/response regulator CckA
MKSNRIREFIDVLLRAGRGDTSVVLEVPEASRDEMDLLAKAINKLVESVRKKNSINDQRERFLNSIIDQNPHPIWISDNRGTLVRINQACCKLLHVEVDEVKGRYNILADNIVEEQGNLPLVRSVFEEGRIARFSIEYDTAQLKRLRLEQTNRVSLEVTISPVRDESGAITNAIIMHNDITESKRLQEQLLHSRKMQAVGQLAGGIAHDFNNMLAVILGYSELIKSKLSSDSVIWDDLLEIEKAARHSKDVTNQLLSFSRKQVISPKVMDLNNQIMQVQKALSLLIGEDISLRFVPGKGLGKIRFDPSQIDQILFNLAANARDAMPTGGELTIETASIEIDDKHVQSDVEGAPGRYAVMAVSDTGAGMDEAMISRIFEPFFTTKAVGRGTGLGLATIYGIVKQNGGLIGVHSELGHGTTFKIYLPRAAEEDDLTREDGESTPAVRAARILLVEDDEMVRKLTFSMLERLGHTVVVAATPSECLKIAGNADVSFDLLITDVVMPEMSGVELRDRFKAMRPEMRVLFVSGYTANIVVHHGVLDDETTLLLKPFTLQDLSRKIGEVLEGT